MRKNLVSPVRAGFSLTAIVLPVIVLILSIQVAFAQPLNKQQIKRQKATFNIQIAKEQMNRGLHREAEALLMSTISNCGQYVTSGTRQSLDNLLIAARSGVAGGRKAPTQVSRR